MKQVNRLEITPDKRYLAAAGNPHIKLFDVNSNSPHPVMKVLPFFIIIFFFVEICFLCECVLVMWYYCINR